MPATSVTSAQTLAVTMEMQVPFFDVDSMDIVWHGHYAKYFELARCALLDKIGFNYQAMAAAGFSFPIIELQIKYIKPLKFNQMIRIKCQLAEWEYRLKLRYEIEDLNSGETLTKGTTTQATVKAGSDKLSLECPAEMRLLVAAVIAAENQ